jgi:hypothetical protein
MVTDPGKQHREYRGGQRTARDTEDTEFPLYLWLLSVPLCPPVPGLASDLGSSWFRLQTAGNPWRGHHARRPCPYTSAVAGRTKLPWGRRERWEGLKRGRGPSAFFQRHLSRLSAPRPTIPASPDAMRDPANRPLARDPARTLRAFAGPRLRKIAHRGFVGSGSGALTAERRRRGGDEVGGIGIFPKTRMAPCRASIPLPLPTRPHTRGATPAWRRALTPFHCIAVHLARAGGDKQLQPDPAMNFESSWIRLQTAGQPMARVTTRGARVHTRRPSRGAQPVSGDAGNGGRTEARQGAIRIFSETPFPPQRPATHPSGFTRCAIP